MTHWIASNALVFLVTSVLFVFPGPAADASDLKVASFHPLLTDLANQVGGDRVTVSAIVTVKDDPHDFAPTVSDLRKLGATRLILVSGKGLETFLPKLRDNVSKDQVIIEVGKTIPSIKVAVGSVFIAVSEHDHRDHDEGDGKGHDHNHAHGHNAIDPHWWHSTANMKRAASVLAQAFGGADPEGKAYYEANANAYRAELDALSAWAKKQFAAIPRSQRKLVTAHAAFGYFCKEFGFRCLALQGMTRENEPTARDLARTIRLLKKEKVTAVFAEASANPKVLKEMVRATGVRLGGELIADGTGHASAETYDGMMRHNVTTIAEALTP